MDTSTPFYFVHEYIENILATEHVILTEEQKNFYIPQLSAMAEKKLGADLMARLNDQQLEQFEELFSNPDTTGEMWTGFWKNAIPDFSEAVEESMQSFSERLQELLAHQ